MYVCQVAVYIRHENHWLAADVLPESVASIRQVFAVFACFLMYLNLWIYPCACMYGCLFCEKRVDCAAACLGQDTLEKEIFNLN